MTEAQAMYEYLADKLTKEDGIAHGKMMTAPAVKYRGKVFVFFHQEKMTFKLGKDFDPTSQDITEFSYLSPFKNKPPMKAWFEIPFSQKDKWATLAQLALEKMKK